MIETFSEIWPLVLIIAGSVLGLLAVYSIIRAIVAKSYISRLTGKICDAVRHAYEDGDLNADNTGSGLAGLSWLFPWIAYYIFFHKHRD